MQWELHGMQEGNIVEFRKCYQSRSYSRDYFKYFSPSYSHSFVTCKRIKHILYVSGTSGRLQYNLVANKVVKALNVNPPSVILWPSEDRYIGIGQKEALSHSEHTSKHEIRNYLETMHDTVEKQRSSIIPLIRERDILIKKNLPLEQHLEKIFAIKE